MKTKIRIYYQSHYPTSQGPTANDGHAGGEVVTSEFGDTHGHWRQLVL